MNDPQNTQNSWEDKVAVAILNWNGEKLLKQFLPSVLRFSPKNSVFVIDNKSSDSSLDVLKTQFPEVQVIQLEHNYGFSGGYNKGIECINKELIVFLNSDVEVTANWLEPICRALLADENLAIAVPKIKDYKNKSLFEYAGAAGGFLDIYGYPFCRGRLFEELEEDKGQFEDVKDVFWASGACFFIKKTVYEKLGGLDEDFFAHLEEIDLCWRTKNAGYAIRYFPQSQIFHVGGATLGKGNPRKTYLNFRNSLVCLFKNTSTKHFRKHIFFRLVLDGLAALVFLSKGQFGHFKAVFFAHMDFYFRFGLWKRKRREIEHVRKKFTDKELYPKSIALVHKLGGIKTFKELKF